MNHSAFSFLVLSLSGCFAVAGCASGESPEPNDPANEASNDSTVDTAHTAQSLLDTACYNDCVANCDCADIGYKPTTCMSRCKNNCKNACQCNPNCTNKTCGTSDGCGGLCSSGTCPTGLTCGGGGVANQCGCTPQCSGAACGGSDGCGGICSNGTCPVGTLCGAVTAGQCANAPDLWPAMTATYHLVGFASKQGHYVFNINNSGTANASNVKILIQSNLPTNYLNLSATNGLSCYFPSGYEPRLGIECVGGSVPVNGTATVTLDVSFVNSGPNVMSIIVDPNDTIKELPAFPNMTNATLQVP
jgi:hypothetical protein